MINYSFPNNKLCINQLQSTKQLPWNANANQNSTSFSNARYV